MLQSTTDNKSPGYAKHPQYAIKLELSAETHEVTANGVTLAKSSSVLVMTEGNYAPVLYFPKADVNMDLFTKSSHTTFCPFKGQASYWDYGDIKDIAWSYETPYDEMLEIAEYVAFYGDKVD